ncbi:alpha-ketoglutarate-dependent dioxygenase AlkB [Acidiferrimicrobium sp. IK]|uniref:alpha-ketoglutarate-dependent dioxygenase AlkB n=1 Tax=Acidiferrimicrobium sp. IK TaxID=2871700 RepID=UPI0021CB7B9D|nr:alpha-ketoglutarate-dependent dioxygenase AlkB [Acidiferrimicrobium sp. IK]MCU4184326.1 alpha-ketoglutarate-dependent dioxygenase AlkB [Acidiferrimicrobium sp. IK]
MGVADTIGLGRLSSGGADASVSGLDAPGLYTEVQVTRVALDTTSWIDVVEGLVPGADRLHRELLDGVPWRQGRVWRYERWIAEPRLGAFQKGPGRHPQLAAVEEWLAGRYRVGFDGVALAHYRDERDGVGWHRDRELRWLDDTIVGVLTLGARRPWRLRPLAGGRREADDLRDVVELQPRSGDLLVMGGRCQADWLHTVPQLRSRCPSRVSAQWRWTSQRGQRDTQPGFFAPRHFSR